MFCVLEIMAALDPDVARFLAKIMRADLDAWSNIWFWILVGSTISVVAGILFEAPEVWQAVGVGRKTSSHIREFWYIRVRKSDLNGWERLCPELVGKNERHRKWIARAGFLGWTLVALGVAGEGVAEYFVNDAETNRRAFDQAVLTETQQSANSAAMASSLANTFSDKAVATSLNSLTLAKGARQEADSFKKDIALAKTQAAEAESHLKDAMQLGMEATAELKRVTSPRTLSQYSKLADSLKPFKDVEYVFSAVSADKESIDFLVKIDELLKAAGWKRGKSVGGFPGINPRGARAEPDFSVPESLTVGVQITVGSPSSDKQLQSMPGPLWPIQVQAAVTLNTLLFGNTLPTPRPTDVQPVVVDVGESTQVRIDVGKKP